MRDLPSPVDGSYDGPSLDSTPSTFFSHPSTTKNAILTFPPVHFSSRCCFFGPTICANCCCFGWSTYDWSRCTDHSSISLPLPLRRCFTHDHLSTQSSPRPQVPLFGRHVRFLYGTISNLHHAYCLGGPSREHLHCHSCVCSGGRWRCDTLSNQFALRTTDSTRRSPTFRMAPAAVVGFYGAVRRPYRNPHHSHIVHSSLILYSGSLQAADGSRPSALRWHPIRCHRVSAHPHCCCRYHCSTQEPRGEVRIREVPD